MANLVKNKNRSIFKTTVKIFSAFLTLFVAIAVLAFVLFYIYKNDISRAIIEKTSKLQQGELTFQDISLSPFAQFPSVSIKLENLYFFEHPRNSVNSTESPIASIENIYVAFNLMDLIRGKINVPKVTIVGGNINIITYADSTVNLFNALNKEGQGKLNVTKDISSIETNKKQETKSIVQDTVESNKSPKIDLSVDILTLKNIKLRFKNYALNRSSSFRLNELMASFIYREKRILSELSTDIDIESISYTDKSYLTGNHVNLNTSLSFDEENNIVEIKPSQLIFEQAQFDINGNIDLSKDGLYDINVDGSDHDFSFFSLVLSEQGIRNLESGDFYFNGTIKGKASAEIPTVQFYFGVKDVDLLIPEVNQRIKDFNFSGYFNSGSKKDLSGANLKIDKLTAKLPDGYLNGSFYFSSFASPYLDLKWNMKTNLNGFDNIFKLEFINDLSGTIEITDTVEGYYNKDKQRIEANDNRSTIICEDLSFNLPGILEVQKFDGIINRNLDQFELKDLVILAGETDLLINGKINNLNYIFFEEEHDLSANLKIQSKLFDFPNFLAFDPTIGRDFPYRIKDIDVDVGVNTTTSNIKEFKSFPDIDYKINRLKATVENFLPPIQIMGGTFKISESVLGFNMRFIDFKINLGDGNLNFTSEYNSSKQVPYYVKGNFGFNSINPGKIFYDEPEDNIPEFFNGSLNGSMFLELQFPEDSSEIKLLNINKADLNYYFADDTLSTKSLKFKTEDVYFNLDKNENPLATLTTDIILESKELFTNYFRLKDLHYDIKCKNGTYTVHPKARTIFGSVGQGIHTLKPFDEIPYYSFKYSIKQFNSEDLLKAFLEDTVLTGKMDFSMDVSMSGNEWDHLVSRLNGEILLSGKDITMYGVDTDNLLEKFKRSQSFNLIDVGAVVLAGPVGLAVTKGTDFASIIITNPGEETHITHLVSDWDIHDGKLNILDVAFTTKKNRIAAKGWIDLSTDSLDVTIAALDKYGCSIFKQNVFGALNEPQTGKLKVVSAILAPVTNLFSGIFGVDCEVFYEGSVVHPK